MRIAFLVNQFPKISETFILYQITGLIDRGCSVDIFCERSKEELFHKELRNYHLHRRIHYIDASGNYLRRYLKAISLIFINFTSYPKITLKSLNVFKYGRWALSLRPFYTAIAFLKTNENYDIVHCHFGTNGILAAILKEVGIFPKSKIITQFHGICIRLGVAKSPAYYKKLIERGDNNLSISEYNRKNLIDFGFNKGSLIRHPVGINLNKFSYKWNGDSQEETNSIKILTVGRMVMEKGYTYGIKAIKKCVEVNPNIKIRYNIVGDGECRSELETLIRELNLENVINLLGVKNHQKVISLLSQSHIFLLPSVAEALPVVLMEAQAVGLPVVATDVGSVNEIVIDGKSGFIVESKDVNSLSIKLNFLINNPKKWPKMGKVGRDHVLKKFDLNALNDQLLKIYYSLIDYQDSITN